MKIAVFDVPAEHGGALTILEMYYNEACLDKENEYIFILSTPKLEEHHNVKVINFPWIKKSWIHRLFFDYFVSPSLIKKIKPGKILSLQNTIVRNYKYKIHQVVYLHQALPFIEKKFKINESFKFWMYQNVISRLIIDSLKKADNVIVQTAWMKKACIDVSNIDPQKVEIIAPKVLINIKEKFEINTERIIKHFIYPASGLKYKNHEIIIDAVSKINHKNIKIYFTLNGNENDHIKSLKKIIDDKKLPIEFIGHNKLEEIYKMYQFCTLLFPSYIETYGLPLLEAKMHETPIIASNCAFSKEILDGYEKVKYFDPSDSQQLANIINEHINI